MAVKEFDLVYVATNKNFHLAYPFITIILKLMNFNELFEIIGLITRYPRITCSKTNFEYIF